MVYVRQSVSYTFDDIHPLVPIQFFCSSIIAQNYGQSPFQGTCKLKLRIVNVNESHAIIQYFDSGFLLMFLSHLRTLFAIQSHHYARIQVLSP